MSRPREGAIWLLTGVPGAGKSTTARSLCARYARAIHIPVDEIREFVISGYASPLEPWTAETTRQFKLARATAVRMAVDYTDVGFQVVIDDVVQESDLGDYVPHLAGRSLLKVALLPPLRIALERNRRRTNKSFDPAVLEPHAVWLDRTLREGCRSEDGWIVLDTAGLDPEATATELLRLIAAR